MNILRGKLFYISCILALQFLLVCGFWHGKAGKGKDKQSVNKKYNQYVQKNSVWNHSEAKKPSKKQSLVCKSDKFSEKVKVLYKCKESKTVSYSSKKSPKLKKSYRPPSCKDDNIYCATWASLSECTANPSWMLVHCPIACNKCNAKCGNYNTYCDEWARAGECFNNREYMSIYCKQSCSFCSTVSISTCQDSDSTKCARWGRKGYCTSARYKDFMRGKCKKTCRTCPV